MKYIGNSTEKTLKNAIALLKQENIICDLNSNNYSILEKDLYNYVPNREVKKIYSTIQSEYPEIKTVIWSTDIINEFTLHYSLNNYIIVETEKFAIELIVNLLKEKYLKKYTVVTEEILIKNRELYINSEKLLVVKKLHIKSPLIENQRISIEKIMIDLYKDKLYEHFQGRELEIIYENIFKKYEINMKRLLAYAKYRTNINEFIEFINKLEIPKKYKIKE